VSAVKQDIEQLMNQARTRLVGVSDAGLKGELFDVFKEFFNTSSCWFEDITLNIVANTTAYNIVPTGGQIIRLAGVFDVNNLPQPAIMPELGLIHFRHPYNVAQVFTATVV